MNRHNISGETDPKRMDIYNISDVTMLRRASPYNISRDVEGGPYGLGQHHERIRRQTAVSLQHQP